MGAAAVPTVVRAGSSAELATATLAHALARKAAAVRVSGSEKQERLLTTTLYASWGGPPPEEDGAPRRFLATAKVGL